jgi:hypothetical protein
MTSFIPRAVFPTLDSLPRSYYLGHHAAGLAKMRTMLSQIDLIVECRDYRIPLTSRNPMFEDSLAGRERMVVYTKKDLGSNGTAEDTKVHISYGKQSGVLQARADVRYLCRGRISFANGTNLHTSSSPTTRASEMFGACLV